MDLTPPLSRSPASPPNSYCPSESSSLGYPSPDLVAQPYKLSSIYGAGLPCSMTPPMDPDTSLPPMEAMGPAGWSQATVLQPSSSSGAVPSILSSEYDPFGSYEHGLAGAYAAHDVYASHASQEASLAGTPPPGSHPRSPVPPPTSRTPLSYVSGPSVVNPMTPRVKLETPAPDYNQNLDVGHYPSPRSVQAPYSVDPSAYPATTTVGYLADAAVPAWAQPLEPGQYFTGSGSPTPGQAQDRSFRVARHRRARRLTTKEEANFQCEVKGCGKLFSRSYNFKAHMETHDEKREYPFPCQAGDCNKKFVRKTDLQRHHQSVHMKERNHRCDYCGRMFARKDTLRRHMDDGCSKRFDIGTLDLRTENYDSLQAGPRPAGSPIAHLAAPLGSLPPLAMPSIGGGGGGGGGLLAPVPPPLRSRDVLGADPGHAWGR